MRNPLTLIFDVYTYNTPSLVAVVAALYAAVAAVPAAVPAVTVAAVSAALPTPIKYLRAASSIYIHVIR